MHTTCFTHVLHDKDLRVQSFDIYYCLVQRGKRQFIDNSLVHKVYLIWTVQEAQLFIWVCIFSVFVLYKYCSCLALISQNPSCILRYVFLKESVIKAVILRSGRYSSMSSVLFVES